MGCEPLTVRIYGDSLALPRLDVVSPRERYVALLTDWWRGRSGDAAVDVMDRTKNNQTVVSLRDWWAHDNAYFGAGSDVLIIHCGICDCAPRPLSSRERAVLSSVAKPLRDRIVRFLHDHRAWLVRQRELRTVPPELFASTWRSWLAEAAKLHQRIHVLAIAPTNDSAETRSPGLSASIRRYNDILSGVVAELNARNVRLVDVYNAILRAPEGVDAFVLKEDGQHLTARAHRLYFEQIRALEQAT